MIKKGGKYLHEYSVQDGNKIRDCAVKLQATGERVVKTVTTGFLWWRKQDTITEYEFQVISASTEVGKLYWYTEAEVLPIITVE